MLGSETIDQQVTNLLKQENKQLEESNLSKQPLAKQLAQRYLEATLPELAALAQERTINAAED